MLWYFDAKLFFFSYLQNNIFYTNYNISNKFYVNYLEEGKIREIIVRENYAQLVAVLPAPLNDNSKLV